MALQARHRFIVSRLTRRLASRTRRSSRTRARGVDAREDQPLLPRGSGASSSSARSGARRASELEAADPEAAAAARAAPRRRAPVAPTSDGNAARAAGRARPRGVLHEAADQGRGAPPPLDPTSSPTASSATASSTRRSSRSRRCCAPSSSRARTQQPRVWGKASAEHQNEFMVGVDGFLQNVNEPQEPERRARAPQADPSTTTCRCSSRRRTPRSSRTSPSSSTSGARASRRTSTTRTAALGDARRPATELALAPPLQRLTSSPTSSRRSSARASSRCS